MGRVWLKTKYDFGMKIDIPHSINLANAMYGFRELGAEIVPYHSLDEIYDQVDRKDIVLDYVEQCNTIFNKLPSTIYAKMISARWAQLFEREDEFYF